MHVVIRGSGNFLDAAAREKLLERQTMEAAKRSNDRMEEQIQVSFELMFVDVVQYMCTHVRMYVTLLVYCIPICTVCTYIMLYLHTYVYAVQLA